MYPRFGSTIALWPILSSEYSVQKDMEKKDSTDRYQKYREGEAVRQRRRRAEMAGDIARGVVTFIGLILFVYMVFEFVSNKLG